MSKIGRDAFLYMEPKPPKADFAQCASCFMFIPERKECAILGPGYEVLPDDSCGLYVHGDSTFEESAALVTPEESGFVSERVQCHRCVFGGEHCRLYVNLNRQQSEFFDLETKISPNACCNAWIGAKR